MKLFSNHTITLIIKFQSNLAVYWPVWDSSDNLSLQLSSVTSCIRWSVVANRTRDVEYTKECARYMDGWVSRHAGRPTNKVNKRKRILALTSLYCRG
jgi:hypothetical protein